MPETDIEHTYNSVTIEEPLYKDFFDSLARVDNAGQMQKEQGFNDFSLFGALAGRDDSQVLVTRLLLSLLDPAGTHYRGDLFLKAFLKQLRVSSFNLGNATVDASIPGVDIYISDGTQHLLVFTGHPSQDPADHMEQVIEQLIRTSSLNPQRIVEQTSLFYLTPQGELPSPRSLGIFFIDGGTMYTSGARRKSFEQFYDEEIDAEEVSNTRFNFENRRLKRKRLLADEAISMKFEAKGYRQTILPWLISCENELHSLPLQTQENLSNLINSLEEFRDAVEHITQPGEPEVMTVFSYLTRRNEENQSLASSKNLQLALEICAEETRLKGAALHEFFHGLEKRYKTVVTVHEHQYSARKCEDFYRTGKNKQKYFGVLITHNEEVNGPFFVSVQATVNNLYVGVFNGREDTTEFRQLASQLPPDYRHFKQYDGWYSRKICSLVSLKNLAALIDEGDTPEKHTLDQEIRYLLALLERSPASY